MWITKVFNIYSLNWSDLTVYAREGDILTPFRWPSSIGFPLTVSIIAAVSIAVPIPLSYIPQLREHASRNTLWMGWTFFTMAIPLLIAVGILLNNERHLGLRHSLSETQRIFTSSWWTGEGDTITAERARRPQFNPSIYDPDSPLEVAMASDGPDRAEHAKLRKRWIPFSFVRFLWFCSALSIAIVAYLLGETYAEIYLRTLPHNTIETIFYVYSWVITVHLLDGLTGWILGGNEGERVGSYPLGWIFKL